MRRGSSAVEGGVNEGFEGVEMGLWSDGNESLGYAAEGIHLLFGLREKHK